GASSGGAGAAMAAGLCSLATGGDGGGSIRIPSSYCGLYGLKNTQGRVPKYSGTPAQHIPNYLSQQGPMSRSVRDSAMMLEVLAGHDPRDPASLRGTIPDYIGSLNKDIKGLRLGWSSDFGYTNSEPEVLEITSKAAKIFQDLGCSLDESKLKLEDPFYAWWTIYTNLVSTRNFDILEANKEKLTWYMKYVFESGVKSNVGNYIKALGERDIMISKFEDEFEKFDLLLSPTMPTTAFPVDNLPKSIAGKEVSPSPAFGFLPFTHPINTIGYTAATVPCGFSNDGMPIGLHIIGKRGADDIVMAASSAFEKAKPWTQHMPPVS
ncbi:MAG: glutamyl-tRNA amidotransferase, partial [Chloroflexi bacterium]|nr:glutamyl-tRNA amidotransferase [Chloroflexota bacterium]